MEYAGLGNNSFVVTNASCTKQSNCTSYEVIVDIFNQTVAATDTYGSGSIIVNCSDTSANTSNCTSGPALPDIGVHSPGLNRPIIVLVCIGIVLSAIIFTTTLGNILVILSPCVNRRLRSVTNTFLVSLALADTLLGILVLPFSLYLEIHRAWHMGPVFCNIYISLDVLLCTASILNLFAICVDRYFVITRPYQYPMMMNIRRAMVVVIIIWGVSLLISFLPLEMGWNTDDGKVQNYDDPRQCSLAANATYALVDGILLFYVPLTTMSVMYIRIVLIAREQAKKIKKTSVWDAQCRRSVDEHKATKIIAIVMGCFIVCWVPYFTVFTFCPIFECKPLSPDAYAVILWLGYLNSAVNPCLYAALNREFRQAFKILLHLNRCPSRKKRRLKKNRASTRGMLPMRTSSNMNSGNGTAKEYTVVNGSKV
uniref:Histamine H2 receptor-like n=1 Tax=Saccoglossus kowalevskii TaxID=10224 RepID=A0ABM0MP54_SACKO|nr:PREDICTED: histamine H2 receptor-like [Saccoglossus kowalevskii]